VTPKKPGRTDHGNRGPSEPFSGGPASPCGSRFLFPPRLGKGELRAHGALGGKQKKKTWGGLILWDRGGGTGKKKKTKMGGPRFGGGHRFGKNGDEFPTGARVPVSGRPEGGGGSVISALYVNPMFGDFADGDRAGGPGVYFVGDVSGGGGTMKPELQVIFGGGGAFS